LRVQKLLMLAAAFMLIDEMPTHILADAADFLHLSLSIDLITCLNYKKCPYYDIILMRMITDIFWRSGFLIHFITMADL
jgi:hypothetical protein